MSTPTKYTFFGRVLPERADVHFAPEVWKNDQFEVQVECDASQLVIRAVFAADPGFQSAEFVAEQIAQAIVNSLGFALGSGYGVEIVSVVPADGQALTWGVRPGSLEFEHHEEVFSRAMQLAKRDVHFRFALRDYASAITSGLDCVHYCYRAMEALKSSIEAITITTGWTKFHDVLGTDKESIQAVIKDYADPIRHGAWTSAKPTTAAQRRQMLQLTRNILHAYLTWRLAAPA